MKGNSRFIGVWSWESSFKVQSLTEKVLPRMQTEKIAVNSAIWNFKLINTDIELSECKNRLYFIVNIYHKKAELHYILEFHAVQLTQSRCTMHILNVWLTCESVKIHHCCGVLVIVVMDLWLGKYLIRFRWIYFINSCFLFIPP